MNDKLKKMVDNYVYDHDLLKLSLKLLIKNVIKFSRC